MAGIRTDHSQQSRTDVRLAQELAAYPELSDNQLARVRAYGRPDELEAGEAAFSAGDPTYDLIVIEWGAIEVVRAATLNAPEASLIIFGPGAFVGELGLLTGQTAYLTARVVERARVHRISPSQLRRLMAEDPELSDLLLRPSSRVAGGSAQDRRLASCRSSEVDWTRQRWRFAPTLGGGSCLTSGWTLTLWRAGR